MRATSSSMANDATQAASSSPAVPKSAYKHMNINIDATSDSEVTMQEMMTIDNSGNADSLVAVDIVKKPDVNATDGESDSDSDWQQCPSTPRTGSAGSVDAEESVTVTQEPPQYSSWFGNVDRTETESAFSTADPSASVGRATVNRTAHEPLVSGPLNPVDLINDIHIPTWPIPTSIESLYMNRYERFWHEFYEKRAKEQEQKEQEQEEREKKEREDILREAKDELDTPSIASGIPGPAGRIPMPRVGRSGMDVSEHSSILFSREASREFPLRQSPREAPREGPPPLRVAPRSTAPYPHPSPLPASVPVNPFAACRWNSHPGNPPMAPHNDRPNPFSAHAPRRRLDNFYSGYVPTEPPMSPEPLPMPPYYRSPRLARAQALPPASPHMLDSYHSHGARSAWRHYAMNDDERGPPFSLRVPGAGSVNENGSRAGTHASNSDTITQEHMGLQRELQQLIGLMSELLHGEVRNMAKTVLDLTNDLYDMRKTIASLRHEMDLLKKERHASSPSGNENGSGNGSNGGLAAHAIPIRPFPTHYYPSDSDICPPLNIGNNPRPSFNSPRMPGPSPRLPGSNYASDLRVPRRARPCEPIREHSTTGSLAQDETRSDWGMQGPQSIHDYMGTHDFGRGNDRYNDRDSDSWANHSPGLDNSTYNDDPPVRNSRSSCNGPFGLRLRTVHGTRDGRDDRGDRGDRGDRDSETLPPYTYRHDPTPRSLHPTVDNDFWTTDESSGLNYGY